MMPPIVPKKPFRTISNESYIIITQCLKISLKVSFWNIASKVSLQSLNIWIFAPKIKITICNKYFFNGSERFFRLLDGLIVSFGAFLRVRSNNTTEVTNKSWSMMDKEMDTWIQPVPWHFRIMKPIKCWFLGSVLYTPTPSTYFLCTLL